MKEEMTNYVIRGVELFAGGIVALLSFAGRSLWKDYKELREEVETVREEMEKDAIRVTGKHSEFMSRVDAVENYSRNKFERLEELTDLRFKEINKDLNQLKEGQDKTNSLLAELLRR